MYRVEWLDTALDELTAIWIAVSPSERQRITRITNDLDEDLASSPLDYGESRDGTDRVICMSPLTVYYRVHLEKRVVEILQVVLPRRTK